MSEEKIQVDTTKQTAGTIRIFNGGIGNPTPTILARVTKGLRYFSVSLITMVSATDLFTPVQGKWACFFLGAFVLLLGATDIVVGVQPAPKED